MEYKELQKKILKLESRWHEKRNFSPTEQTVFNHLVEEMGELAMQYVNREQRQGRYSEEEFENALGDIFILIVQLAALRGLNMDDVVLKIIETETKELDQNE